MHRTLQETNKDCWRGEGCKLCKGARPWSRHPRLYSVSFYIVDDLIWLSSALEFSREWMIETCNPTEPYVLTSICIPYVLRIFVILGTLIRFHFVGSFIACHCCHRIWPLEAPERVRQALPVAIGIYVITFLWSSMDAKPCVAGEK